MGECAFVWDVVWILTSYVLDNCDVIKLFLFRTLQVIFHQLTTQKDLKVIFLALGMIVENEITI